MDGLIDLRLETLRGGSGPDSELDQAMQMLGMIVPGILPGMNQDQSVPGQNQDQPTETDLVKFSKTEKGKKAFEDFKEWKNQDG